MAKPTVVKNGQNYAEQCRVWKVKYSSNVISRKTTRQSAERSINQSKTLFHFELQKIASTINANISEGKAKQIENK